MLTVVAEYVTLYIISFVDVFFSRRGKNLQFCGSVLVR